MKLLWSEPAVADRRQIRLFVSKDNPTAAVALDELFSEKASRLSDHQHLGRPGKVAGTRELVVHRNYILVYAIADETVRILRVLHAARQWPPRQD